MSILKRAGRLLLCVLGFMYDYMRYCLYSAWRQDLKNKSERNYMAVKVYHSLEKSLSLKNRRKSAGWENTKLLHKLSLKAIKGGDLGFQDKVGLNVLRKFSSQLTMVPEAQEISRQLDHLEIDPLHEGGILEKTNDDFFEGKLKDPERFFLSRHTLRDYSDREVECSTVMRAIKLAMRSPSACNRQAWHVYDLKSPDAISKALSCQNGNRGFGHNAKRLLVITSDLRAFVSPKERYQHWIDGGMFAMSLVWAFHSLGVASCCLNWSQGPSGDIHFRKLVPIEPAHSVIMLIALGYPDNENKVCASPRRPIQEVYTKI